MTQQPRDIEIIFSEALEIRDPKEREQFLEQACGGDTGLRQRLQELLDAHAQATGSFMDSPPTSTVDAKTEPSFRSGTQVGPYRLLQKLGEGGFGVVFAAEQKEPVNRRVALKVLKLGMDTGQVLARFEAERQALAMMDHPGIAKVFDAGATPEGRPYFVMELVKGEPISRYCDKQHLTPNQRLGLFVKLCHAVHHAHQKGIIHRDLKPQNVLVAEYDRVPAPKVIDFGIANATNQKLTEKTVFTETGQMIGTLEYMSPEQAELSQLDIDTRSDIYSLGVILYELLTGVTPFEARQLRSAGYAEMLRIIREEEPPKPSTRISGWGESTQKLSGARRLSIQKMRKLVHGDLDWIVMKALEKDRGRRYESASAFADDVQRFLDHEPVVARSPSTVYRLQKFARRHRTGLSVAACVGMFLGVVLGYLQWQSGKNRSASAFDRITLADAGNIQDRIASASIVPGTWSLLEQFAGAPDSPGDPQKLLNVRLALASRDKGQAAYLLNDLVTAKSEYVRGIIEALEPHRDEIEDLMWKKLHQSPPETDALRFRTGLALASLYPDSNKWRDSDFEFLSKHLVENLSNDRDWATNFRDIAPECSVFWRNTFLAAGSQLLGQNAAVLLAHFESNSPEQMASMLVSATPQQYQIVFDPVLDNPSREYRNAVVAFLSRVASENPPNGLPEAERIRHGKRRANAGITLLRLNEPELALTSLEIQDDPESITQFIHGCVSRKVEASLLLECFDKVQASTQLQQNATIRHALLLALGEYELSKFGAEKERLSQQIVSLYRDDPSSAVHGAARWVLYKWQRTKEIVAIDRTEREYSPQREWFVKKLELPRNAGETFLTFVVFKPGKFDVGAIPGEHDISSEDDPLERALLNEYGSPGDEAPLEFEAFESRHPTEISRPFAILDREVYHREVKSFKPDHAKLMRIYQASNDVDPAPGLMWYDAVDFCRSMNEQLGIPEDQQPHTIASTNGSEMKSGAGEDASNSSEAWLIHQERRGLRLPTEAEWEVACRAGARTPFGHGSDEALLAEYAWLGINSRKDIHLPKTRKPNLRGLFDMHGNLFEWTYDRRAKYPNPVPTDYTGSPTGKVRVLRGGCWGVMPYLARSAFRMGTAPDFSFVFMGIRPAMTLPSDAEFAGGLDKSDSLVRAQ